MNTVETILGGELYKQIRSKLGNDNGLIIDDGMLIPKHRFDCINISLKEHKILVKELKEENARIKAGIARLEEVERELAKLNAERSILEIVLNAKPKNYKAVMSLINTDGLTGKKLSTSVKKQVADIKKAEPYLFYDAEQLYRLVPVGRSDQTEFENE